MVKVMMGPKGTGKTKQMIDLINTAVDNENGNVVAIAHGSNLTFDISYKIRLIDTSEYKLGSLAHLQGFINGLYASNYDITHVFVESLTKIIPCEVNNDVEDFLDWLEGFSEKRGIKFTVSISADASLASEGIRKYF